MAPRIGPFRGRGFSPGVAVAIRQGEREATAQQQATGAGGLTFDPELYPPATSRSLVLTDQMASAGAGVIVPPGLTRRLDKGFVGVFRQLTLFADAPDILTRATWALLVNGLQVAGLEQLTMIFRAASSQSTSFDTLRLVVPPGGLVSVAITNVDGVARIYGAQLVGWTYPRQRADGAST